MFDIFLKSFYHYYMSKTLLFETKSVLAELRFLRRSVYNQSRRFSDCEQFTMTNSFHKGSAKEQYYLKQKGSPGRVYIGTGKAKTVRRIKTSRYYNKLLQVIDNDIKLFERVDQEYILPDHSSVNNMLPKVYRSDDIPEIMPGSRTAAEWKKEKEAEKAKYAPYRPEELIYQAQDGTMMRSLSEVIIANYLLSLGITFVYEMPLIYKGKRIWPDFTILSPVDNKTVIIIEHQGAMGSEKYQGKFIRTLLFYLETKLVPNKDVFFTFSHLDGNLDLSQIDFILHIAFGINCSKPAS